MASAEQRVWDYLLKHRKATTEEVALNADVTEEYAASLIRRISSKDWREEYKPAEGKKFDDGKVRMDLLPPELENAVAAVLTFGARKYGDRNWETGMRWGRVYAAVRRHMAAWWAGEDLDPETGMSHMWHAACGVAFLIAYEARNTGTDDRLKLGDSFHVGMAKEEGADSEAPGT